MAPPKKWPGTETERQDRDRVVELVARVGEKRLRFGVADLRREMEEVPRLALHHSRQLHRHVADLPDTLLRRVDQALTLGFEHETRSRAKHTFVLTHRLREYEGGAKDLDDLERLHFALWVAFIALHREPVPTFLVTRVTKEVEALAPDRDQQTNSRLSLLANREQPLAEKLKPTGSRWVLWRPIGSAPSHPEFESWLEQFVALIGEDGAVASTGSATRGELARELVRISIEATKSRAWPKGRSVTVSDMKAASGKHPRAKELLDKLRIGGRSLGTVLGDASKERIGGRKRVHQRVVKIPNPWGEATYYDLPDEPGFEHRSLVVPFRGAQRCLAPRVLEEIVLELRAAERLARNEGPEAAVGAIRLRLVQEELDQLEDEFADFRANLHFLSKTNRKAALGSLMRLSEFRKRRGTTAAAQAAAEDVSEEWGLDLETILAAPRPLLRAPEYAEFFPKRALRGLKPAEFLARARPLRRFPNPDYLRQPTNDPILSASTAVDRVDALVYAALTSSARSAAFLQAGANLLGRNLRSSALPEMLLTTGKRTTWRAALAALVLLGSDAAEVEARRAIGDPQSSPEVIIDALCALLVLGSFDKTELPERLLSSRSSALRQPLTQVIIAHKQGRRLLQR